MARKIRFEIYSCYYGITLASRNRSHSITFYTKSVCIYSCTTISAWRRSATCKGNTNSNDSERSAYKNFTYCATNTHMFLL